MKKRILCLLLCLMMIVSMTQISMLGADYVNGEVEVAYGENEAVVVKDYDIVENSNKTTT